MSKNLQAAKPQPKAAEQDTISRHPLGLKASQPTRTYILSYSREWYVIAAAPTPPLQKTDISWMHRLLFYLSKGKNSQSNLKQSFVATHYVSQCFCGDQRNCDGSQVIAGNVRRCIATHRYNSNAKTRVCIIPNQYCRKTGVGASIEVQ